jgi:hypothetical protein
MRIDYGAEERMIINTLSVVVLHHGDQIRQSTFL